MRKGKAVRADKSPRRALLRKRPGGPVATIKRSDERAADPARSWKTRIPPIRHRPHAFPRARARRALISARREPHGRSLSLSRILSSAISSALRQGIPDIPQLSHRANFLGNARLISSHAAKARKRTRSRHVIKAGSRQARARFLAVIRDVRTPRSRIRGIRTRTLNYGALNGRRAALYGQRSVAHAKRSARALVTSALARALANAESASQLARRFDRVVFKQYGTHRPGKSHAGGVAFRA